MDQPTQYITRGESMLLLSAIFQAKAEGRMQDIPKLLELLNDPAKLHSIIQAKPAAKQPAKQPPFKQQGYIKPSPFRK